MIEQLYRKVDPEQPTPWWLVPMDAQECRLAQSKPVELGSGEIVYWITVVSDKPASSLTMNEKVWLIGGSDEA